MQAIFLISHPECTNCKMLTTILQNKYQNIDKALVSRKVVWIHIDPEYQESYFYFVKHLAGKEIQDYPVLITKSRVYDNLGDIINYIDHNDDEYFTKLSFPYPLLISETYYTLQTNNFNLVSDYAPLLCQIIISKEYLPLFYPEITRFPVLLCKSLVIYDDLDRYLTDILEKGEESLNGEKI